MHNIYIASLGGNKLPRRNMDPRTKKLAEVLVNHSILINKDDIIEVSCGHEAKDLALEVTRLILQKGAYPRVNCGIPGMSYTYLKYATDEQLAKRPELRIYEAKKINGTISIGTEYNTKELTGIDPKKIAIRRKATRILTEIALKKDNWVICEYPTNALAQDAEMSLQEFEDFAYKACLIDWKKQKAIQGKIKKVLDKGKEARIVGRNTDIRFLIEGRTAIPCFGERNMPDGEVFIAPVETTTEGHINYDFPCVYMGKEVDDVKLEFKQGKVIKATAAKNEKFLHEMLKMDKGAKYLGEFGIGTNFGINRFIRNILFDEKIGGTIHLALGMAYKKGGGRNNSILHWDMIKDLRNDGAVYIDGKLLEKKGKFSI